MFIARFLRNTPTDSVCKLLFLSAATDHTHSAITSIILSVQRLIYVSLIIQCFAVQCLDEFSVNSVATHSAQQLALQLTRLNNLHCNPFSSTTSTAADSAQQLALQPIRLNN
jgi:hypothetical protein